MAETLIYWPRMNMLNTGGLTSVTLDGLADQLAVVMYAPEDCTITNVQWIHSSYLGSPGTLRIGLQSVSTTSGVATGTWLASGNGYVDKTTYNTGDNNIYQTATLGTSVTLSRGECFAVVLDPLSGTWDAANSVTIGYQINQYEVFNTTPYLLINNAKGGMRSCNLMARSATKAYGEPLESYRDWGIENDIPGQNADGGVKFMIPNTVCSTYQVSGIRIFMDAITGGTFTISLYEGTNRTVMQTIAIDSDQMGTNSTTTGYHTLYFDDSTLDALTAGTTYRLMIEATSAGGNGTLRLSNVGNTTNMTALVPSTHTCHWTEWNGSSYVDSDTVFPNIQLIITDITPPSGSSGGLLVHPGMAGGMRG